MRVNAEKSALPDTLLGEQRAIDSHDFLRSFDHASESEFPLPERKLRPALIESVDLLGMRGGMAEIDAGGHLDHVVAITFRQATELHKFDGRNQKRVLRIDR